MSGNRKVIVFSGRRSDPEDAVEPRFPPGAEPAVVDRLRQLFEESGATTIVSSAACGSDLLALEAAADLGLDRHVILPFDRATFRETSVTDRPGDWGPRYDAILDSLPRDRLVVLRLARGRGAYERTNGALIDLALELGGRPSDVLAVIAWNGAPRSDDDLTFHFAERARSVGLDVTEVDTWSADTDA